MTDPADRWAVRAPEPRTVSTEPQLFSPHTLLRPVLPGDYPFLFRISTSPQALVGWRHRGHPPNPEAFPQSLWQGVFTQFLIAKRDTREPAGLITAYNAEPSNGVVWLAMIISPEFERTGWVMEASTIFVSYLFQVWSFRKVYMEALEFNFGAFQSGLGSMFRLEGCLENHEFHDGRYWHKYLLAIYRDTWEEIAAQLGFGGHFR